METSSFLKTLAKRIEHDNLFMKASSLTYQSFLAIVPLLAVMFGIARGFGGDIALENILRMELADHKEVLEYLLAFSDTALKEVQGGVIAGTGIVALLLTAIKLFSSIERTFNAMWGITIPRRYVHRVMSYLALIAICPLLLILASSMTIFITTKLSTLITKFQFQHFEELVSFAISLIPLATLVTLFSTLLYVIPSAHVSLRSAFASGIVAAIMFQLVQTWYIQFQLSLSQVSAIYGSFVALPLFLAWLWISWFILLSSGELTVAIEERLWRYPLHDIDINPKAAHLALLTLIIGQYKAGKPATVHLFRNDLNIPLKLLYESLEQLKEKNLIHEAITAPSHVLSFVPSISCFTYSLAELIFELPSNGSSAIHKLEPPYKASPAIAHAYERLNDLIVSLDLQSNRFIDENNPIFKKDEILMNE